MTLPDSSEDMARGSDDPLSAASTGASVAIDAPTSATSMISANPPQPAALPTQQLVEILLADRVETRVSDFLEQNFELYEDAFDLYGAVAVEKAVKLGQADDLNEISDYVEKHQSDPDWKLSLETIDFTRTLDLVTAVHDIFAHDSLGYYFDEATNEVLPVSLSSEQSAEEVEAVRFRRLELLHKIWSKIAYDPFNEKVRHIKMKTVFEKMQADQELAEKVKRLFFECGFVLEDRSSTTSAHTAAGGMLRANDEHANAVQYQFSARRRVVAAAAPSSRDDAAGPPRPPSIEDQLHFHFAHRIDTDRLEVQKFHRVFSLLEELVVGGHQPVKNVAEESQEAAEVEGRIGTAEDVEQNKSSKTSSVSAAWSKTSQESRGSEKDPEKEKWPNEWPEFVLSPGLTESQPGASHRESAAERQQEVFPHDPGNQRQKPDDRPKKPLSQDEMREARLKRLEESGKNIDKSPAPKVSLKNALDYGHMRRKVVVKNEKRAVEVEIATGVKRLKPQTTGEWGGFWHLLRDNASQPASGDAAPQGGQLPDSRKPLDMRETPNQNNPVFRPDDAKKPTSELILHPQRRAQHFTLDDVEHMRWRDAIRDAPRYADLWWEAQKQSDNYADIRLRSYDPEFVGRKALDLTNRFRGENGLPPLKWNDDMTRIARHHANQMGRGEMPFSHDGFQERVGKFPFHSYSSAENLAYNQGVSDPATCAVEGWIKSPGHRKNLLSLTNLCGVGVAQTSNGTFYFTQLFAKTSGGLAP